MFFGEKIILCLTGDHPGKKFFSGFWFRVLVQEGQKRVYEGMCMGVCL